MATPNGKSQPPMQPLADPDQMTRMAAIIQSLERMCTESRTRELHQAAAIAVLQEQLAKAQREVAELKPKADTAKPPEAIRPPSKSARAPKAN